MENHGNRADQFLQAGTKVKNDGLVAGGPEYGVVIHCWKEIFGYDCYVAFFGGDYPKQKPEEIPYILRYAAISLTVIEE